MMRLAGVIVVMGLALAAPAAAQDKAAAEAAFREAKRLMAEKQWDAACPKLEASLELDPATGTVLNLADCYSKQGRTASAWASFIEVAQREGQGGKKTARGREAARRAAALEPRLVRLRVVVDAPPPDLRVLRDGNDAGALLGVPVPVDPGTHRVEASAGGRGFRGEIATGKEGETVSLEIPPFWQGVEARAPAPVPAVPPLVVPPPVEGAVGGGRRTAGLVVGAAGVTSVAVGLVFGAKARSDWNASRDGCDEMNVCDDPSYEQVKSAQRSAVLSTVLVGAGAAAVVVGGVLYFTAPRGRSVAVAPSVGPGGAGLAVIGSF